MKKFEILDHIADLKVKVYGRNLIELFINAALVVAEQQAGIKKEESADWEIVEIESVDLESLLVDWLNEILSRSDLNQKAYLSFKIEELTKKRLRAKIAGQKVEQKEIEIKAATYHDLEIKQVNDYWQAVVIFDI